MRPIDPLGTLKLAMETMNEVRRRQTKRAFVPLGPDGQPPPMPQPGAQQDPSQGAGGPPGAQGGIPQGMPQDPSQGAAMPPGGAPMDPSQGGMPPPDPSQGAQGQPGQDPGQPVMVNLQDLVQLFQMIAQQGGGQPPGAVPPAAAAGGAQPPAAPAPAPAEPKKGKAAVEEQLTQLNQKIDGLMSMMGIQPGMAPGGAPGGAPPAPGGAPAQPPMTVQACVMGRVAADGQEPYEPPTLSSHTEEKKADTVAGAPAGPTMASPSPAVASAAKPAAPAGGMGPAKGNMAGNIAGNIDRIRQRNKVQGMPIK